MVYSVTERRERSSEIGGQVEERKIRNVLSDDVWLVPLSADKVEVGYFGTGCTAHRYIKVVRCSYYLEDMWRVEKDMEDTGSEQVTRGVACWD